MRLNEIVNTLGWDPETLHGIRMGTLSLHAGINYNN